MKGNASEHLEGTLGGWREKCGLTEEPLVGVGFTSSIFTTLINVCLYLAISGLNLRSCRGLLLFCLFNFKRLDVSFLMLPRLDSSLVCHL